MPFHCLHKTLALPQAIAVKANNEQSPPSNEYIITMPSMPGPILTSVKPWGPTTGQAVATAPAGVFFSEVIVSDRVRCKRFVWSMP